MTCMRKIIAKCSGRFKSILLYFILKNIFFSFSYLTKIAFCELRRQFVSSFECFAFYCTFMATHDCPRFHTIKRHILAVVFCLKFFCRYSFIKNIFYIYIYNYFLHIKRWIFSARIIRLISKIGRI